MAFAKNQVSFEGNLVADPDTKYSAKGTLILKFRMAHNVSQKNENGDYEDTPIYFGVTAFGRDAEDLGPNLSKGTRVLVEGRMDPPRTYESKNGTAVGLDIVADRVFLVTRPPRNVDSSNGTSTPASTTASSTKTKKSKDDGLEDLPF